MTTTKIVEMDADQIERARQIRGTAACMVKGCQIEATHAVMRDAGSRSPDRMILCATHAMGYKALQEIEDAGGWSNWSNARTKPA